ncbi:hypothetical protein LTR08_003980 [Meristemomyces frigidus]|nr:hypothetical protein LTR08_003980 [Meristemomyces frigidus]
MSARNRIPTALEPYLRLPPEASLILLTGTLGCNANWLTARFVGSLLAPITGPSEGRDGRETAIVLVSWMRDATFWKSEARRTTGVDTAKLSETNRYTFIDCITKLQTLEEIERSIKATLASVGERHDVVLVLDNPDVLLALTLASAQQLGTFLLTLRSLAHSTVLVCSADLPLLSAATARESQLPPTAIEAESAAFVTQQAHNARFVAGVRELGTGAARDVSGVLRVTRGGAAYDWCEEDIVEEVKEMEALYLVQRDGQAKVFERGAAGHG